jgi:hypothetical protein
MWNRIRKDEKRADGGVFEKSGYGIRQASIMSSFFLIKTHSCFILFFEKEGGGDSSSLVNNSGDKAPLLLYTIIIIITTTTTTLVVVRVLWNRSTHTNWVCLGRP